MCAQRRIRPVWSESLLPPWRKLGSLATHWAYSEDWSDWADAQAELSHRWVHTSFCWFCHKAAQTVFPSFHSRYIYMMSLTLLLTSTHSGSAKMDHFSPDATDFLNYIHVVAHSNLKSGIFCLVFSCGETVCKISKAGGGLQLNTQMCQNPKTLALPAL